jgi:hypothetical protein
MKAVDENIKLHNNLVERFKNTKLQHRGDYEKNKLQKQPIIDAIQNLGVELKRQNQVVPFIPVPTVTPQMPVFEKNQKEIIDFSTTCIGSRLAWYLNHNDDPRLRV